MLKDSIILEFSGKEIHHPEELSDIFSFVRRNNMAKAALEGSLWDLYSEKEGIILAEALGETINGKNQKAD